MNSKSIQLTINYAQFVLSDSNRSRIKTKDSLIESFSRTSLILTCAPLLFLQVDIKEMKNAHVLSIPIIKQIDGVISVYRPDNQPKVRIIDRIHLVWQQLQVNEQCI